MAHGAATWLAIVSGISAAVGLGINTTYELGTPAESVTAWLFFISLVLSWIAAGVFYRSGRTKSEPYNQPASATIIPSRPPARFTNQDLNKGK